MPSRVADLSCVFCGTSYQPTDRDMTCPSCGPDNGILEMHFDLVGVKAAWQAAPLAERPLNHWRYRELLPLDPSAVPTNWPVGWTPILELTGLARQLRVRQMFVKDEGRNPTASLKDRASSVGVAHAMQNAAMTIATASTGNAATSLAGHAALAGMGCVIFVPRGTTAPKLAQLLVYGACVFSVAGPYDDAYRLCSAACDRFGWYNRNCAINPVLVEGKKTCGLEIAEQSAAIGGMPDWVVVSVGDGCTLAGIWKGLAEMRALGEIDRLPRLLGVQAKGVAPISYAWEHDALPQTSDGSTLADGINVPVPRNWRKAIGSLRAAEGAMVTVSDEQILAALAHAGRHGVFGEPAAAAAIAGIKVAVERQIIGPSDRVLAVITGSGLKDTAAAMTAAGEPIEIDANLDAVSEGLDAFRRIRQK